MSDPTNTEIADALDELGDLYELDGAAVYRTVAYRNAAKAIRDAQRSREKRTLVLFDEALYFSFVGLRYPQNIVVPGLARFLKVHPLRVITLRGRVFCIDNPLNHFLGILRSDCRARNHQSAK